MTEPEGEVITNVMYPVRGCYQHICATMSGRIKGARPLRMRSSAPRGKKVKKRSIMEGEENVGDSELSKLKSKRRKMSLSLPKDRFYFAIVDDNLKEAMKAYSTKNTVSNNKWALTNFEQWFEQRKETIPDCRSKQPMEVLISNDPTEICQVLSLYVKETRKIGIPPRLCTCFWLDCSDRCISKKGAHQPSTYLVILV